MRNKWFGYAASLIVTIAIVASSVFLPQALLRRQEARMLGVENNQGISRYQSRLFPRVTPTPVITPTPTPAGPTPEATPTEPPAQDQTKRLTLIFRLFENANEYSHFQREPEEGEMGMKEAVKTSITKLMDMMKTGEILPLTNFPDGYDVNASMYSVLDTDGQIGFTYWSMSFNTNPELTKSNGGVGCMLDAETGDILSIKMHTGSEAKDFNLNKSARLICDELRITGKLAYNPPEERDGPESANWIADNKSLFLNFHLSRSADGAAMSMNFSTRLPDQ